MAIRVSTTGCGSNCSICSAVSCSFDPGRLRHLRHRSCVIPYCHPCHPHPHQQNSAAGLVPSFLLLLFRLGHIFAGIEKCARLSF